jgi:DNA polymerase-3 subunit epsilon
MLDNVTRAFEEENLRDQLLHGLTEGSRSSLANIQAAVDMLAYPTWKTACASAFWGWCAKRWPAWGNASRT